MTGGITDLRRRLAAYPQPVARAAGAVARARTVPEQIDAVLKAGEVLARYAAVTVLSSFAPRPSAEPDEDLLPQFAGNLSFGQFIAVAQRIARRPEDHPLAPFVTTSFAAASGRGPAEAALVALLEVRNDLGHGLRHLDIGRAKEHRARRRPARLAHSALDACAPLLELPLLIVEQQVLDQGAVTARCLHLVGESSPFPEELSLGSGVHFASRPYIAVFDGLLSLSPGMIWEPISGVEDICIIEAVNRDSIIFRSSRDSSRVKDSEIFAEFGAWSEGASGPIEPIGLLDGTSLIEHLTGRKPPALVAAPAGELSPAGPNVHADWAEIAAFVGPSGRGLLMPLRDLTGDPVFEGTSSHLSVVGEHIEWRFDPGLALALSVVDGALEIRVVGAEASGVAHLRSREPVEAAVGLISGWLADPQRDLSGAATETEAVEPKDKPEACGSDDDALDRGMVLDRIIDQDVSIALVARELGRSENEFRRDLEDAGLGSLLDHQGQRT